MGHGVQVDRDQIGSKRRGATPVGWALLSSRLRLHAERVARQWPLVVAAVVLELVYIGFYVRRFPLLEHYATFTHHGMSARVDVGVAG